MTTELPRVPRESTPVPARPQSSAQQFADETMELPIFRELESAWFRTRRSTAGESVAGPPATPPGAGSAATTQFAQVEAGGGTQQSISTGTTGNAAMANAPMFAGPSRVTAQADSTAGTPTGYGDDMPVRRPEAPAGGWQTAADDGWRAASAATEVPVAGTTQAGLPKRVPMAQLVPGGVEKPAASAQRRTPEAVRGLLSAYHRGVQRGRSQPSDEHSTNPGATPAGQKSSQAGFGPAARSGQKEHEG
ncbi:MAG TPA: ATPase, partial [Micromonospora sp.]